MNDHNTINIETLEKKYISLTKRSDGSVDIEIRFVRGGHNIVRQCTLTEDRLDMVSRFLSTRRTVNA